MTASEKTQRKEAELRRHISKIRWIMGSLFLIFTVLCIVFAVLRETTAEVVIHGADGLPAALSWKEVKYNDSFTVGFALSAVADVIAGTFFLCNFGICRFRTVEVNGNYLTVCRENLSSTVFVNGDEVGRLGAVWYIPVVEAVMPDGVKVSVTFSRGMLMLAHVSFSDSHESVDL